MTTHEEQTKNSVQPKPVSNNCNDNPVRIWIDIRLSNGLHLSQKNLSYQDLVRTVEKWRIYRSVNGLNYFYYVHNFTDIRCKHSRVLSIIRKRLHREPCDGDGLLLCLKTKDSYKSKI